MKISILLPTRNRLVYLKSAIATVLRQDYDDWEIIVSDNYSEDDIEGYCRSLQDPRVRYFRTDRFVPVTDNWNNALYHSTGDYVIMLGDDDALMRGYLRTMAGLVAAFELPEIVYTGAYIYAYPGVMPGHEHGYLQRNCNPLFGSQDAHWLSRNLARKLVSAAMDLRMLIAFNMQHSLISRRFIDSLSANGPFFQSPYPDFYATNVCLLVASRILVYQRPLVAIGITPRSYGFFHFNKDEAAGREFLNNAPDAASAKALEDTLLPGSKNNTSWLLAMAAIERNYGSQFGVVAGRKHYRFLQIAHAFKNFYMDAKLSSAELQSVVARMSFGERLGYGLPMRLGFAAARFFPRNTLNRAMNRFRVALGQYIVESEIDARRRFNSILDVFETVDPLASD